MSRHLVTIVLLMLWCMEGQQEITRGWKGIVPLHSTREDVERLLGPSNIDVPGFYIFEKESIVVVYSQAGCHWGWKVAADRVMSISVIVKGGLLKLSELNVDLSKYKLSGSGDVRDGVWYTNGDLGIAYLVSRPSGTVLRTSFFPSDADPTPKCK